MDMRIESRYVAGLLVAVLVALGGTGCTKEMRKNRYLARANSDFQSDARNFLLPRGKALRATEANKKKFESQRPELEARNLALKGDAPTKSAKLDGQSYVIIRQAGETGQLYGSVSARDIADDDLRCDRLPRPSQPHRAAAPDQDPRPAQDRRCTCTRKSKRT